MIPDKRDPRAIRTLQDLTPANARRYSWIRESGLKCVSYDYKTCVTRADSPNFSSLISNDGVIKSLENLFTVDEDSFHIRI